MDEYTIPTSGGLTVTRLDVGVLRVEVSADMVAGLHQPVAEFILALANLISADLWELSGFIIGEDGDAVALVTTAGGVG